MTMGDNEKRYPRMPSIDDSDKSKIAKMPRRFFMDNDDDEHRSIAERFNNRH